MLSFLYVIVALVAFSTAKQLNPGPEVSTEALSSAASSKGPGKRYATQEFTLYLTPSEIKALQSTKNLKSKESAEEEQRLLLKNYEENQEQKAWAQYFAAKADEESREQEAFYSKTKPVTETQEANKNSFNLELDLQQKINEQKIQNLKFQLEGQRLESEWTSRNPVAGKKQADLLYEQLQQQWNGVQLKGLSAIDNERQRSEDSSEKHSSILQWLAISNNEEQKKSEIEKEFEYILSDNQGWKNQLAQENRARAESVRINQRQPFLIQKEVRVFNHHPVPVINKVKVPVPTPVLVPVPEPYEVKVPHPYPVPLEIVKHIPIPVLRNN